MSTNTCKQLIHVLKHRQGAAGTCRIQRNLHQLTEDWRNQVLRLLISTVIQLRKQQTNLLTATTDFVIKTAKLSSKWLLDTVGDQLLAKKKHRKLLEPYETRAATASEFVETVRPGLQVTCGTLLDPKAISLFSPFNIQPI